MKLKPRLLFAVLSLAAAGAAIYVRASANNTAAAAASSSESCPDCDGPAPDVNLPNPYKIDAAKPAAQSTPASPATAPTPAKT